MFTVWLLLISASTYTEKHQGLYFSFQTDLLVTNTLFRFSTGLLTGTIFLFFNSFLFYTNRLTFDLK